MRSNPQTTTDEWRFFIKQILAENPLSSERPGAMLASVVPECERSCLSALRAFFGDAVRQVVSGMPLPFENAYQPPGAVGADRLMNVMGALEIANPPFIIIDLGTAITVDVLDESRRYLGGSIFPGLTLAADTLARKTALLPRVDLERPFNGIGRNTADSIRHGVILGAAGAVERIVAEIMPMLSSPAKVFATGGQAALLLPYCPILKNYVPELTLRGLLQTWRLLMRGGAPA
jgi:type III pantothenate kinase